MEEGRKIPKGWLKICLGEVCKLKNGYAFKSSDYLEEGIPVIRISDINEGVVSVNNSVKVIADEEYENHIVRKDDILVAMSGATTGKFGIFRNNIIAYQNQRVGKFQIHDKNALNNTFLLFLLYSLKRKILEDAYGGAQPNISSGKIEELKIPLPPLPEQHRIVAKIEELFSSLDKGIEYLKSTQQQLKVYRQAVLKWAFEGRLTNRDVVEGELPDSWTEKKVSEISDIFGGFAFKSGEFKDNGKYQVLRMGNIRPGVLRYDEKAIFLDEVEENILNKALLRQDDVVISQTGTKGKRDYGYTALIPKKNLLLNQRISAIRCNEKCLPKFFLYYTWTDRFKNQYFANETGNVGQGNVGMKAVTDTLVYLPSIDEQLIIVAEIESRLSGCDKIEEIIEHSLKQAESLRQSILKKAFEGKLVPQDSNDEPASLLLPRIKGEREKNKSETPTRRPVGKLKMKKAKL